MKKKLLISVILLNSILCLILMQAGCASATSLETSSELNLKYGTDLERIGLWKEAILRLENALRLNPLDPKIHNNLAIAYENQGDYEKAEFHYKKALSFDPENVSIKNNYDSFLSFYSELKDKQKLEKQEVKNEK
jgi:type IV pilus assembly protein PilF